MLLGTSFFSKEFSQRKYSLFIIQSAILIKLTEIMQMSSHGSDVFYIFILLNYVKFPAPTVGFNVFFLISKLCCSMDSLESIPRKIQQMVIDWQNLYTRVFFNFVKLVDCVHPKEDSEKFGQRPDNRVKLLKNPTQFQRP